MLFIIYMNNQQYNEISNFTKKVILQTEQKERKITLPYELNLKERNILTMQDLNNKQKLFDFISDKKKLSLQSFFDHKGTKAFLNGKDKAMKRIELDDNIEENINNKRTNKKNKKKKRKSCEFLVNHNYNEFIKKDTIKKNKKSSKNKKCISTNNIINFAGTKLNNINERFVDFEFEQLLWEPHSPTNKRNRIKLIEKKKTKKNNKRHKINNDKSINSISTIDSKLFENKKEDDPIIKDILYELNVKS